MSSDLIVIAFDGLNTAKEVLREIQALAAEGSIVLEEVAIAERGARAQDYARRGAGKKVAQDTSLMHL